MQSSPCKGCRLEHADKRGAECAECRLREDYVSLLGKMTHSVPLEMTDMAGGRKMAENKRYSAEDIQFLKDNVDTMKNHRLAEHLGRTEGAISVQLSYLGLSRKPRKGFKRGLAASEAEETKPAAIESSEEQTADRKEYRNPLEQLDRFVLDFSKYPDLYDRLIEEAQKHFRSPLEQALYYIDNGINGSKIKIVGPRIELVGMGADRDHGHPADPA